MNRRDFFSIAEAATLTGLNLASCAGDSNADATVITLVLFFMKQGSYSNNV